QRGDGPPGRLRRRGELPRPRAGERAPRARAALPARLPGLPVAGEVAASALYFFGAAPGGMGSPSGSSLFLGLALALGGLWGAGAGAAAPSAGGVAAAALPLPFFLPDAFSGAAPSGGGGGGGGGSIFSSGVSSRNSMRRFCSWPALVPLSAMG